MMNRRSFLRGLLMSSAAAATLDIEKMLWVPKTQIVVPAMPSLAGKVYWISGELFDYSELLKQIYVPRAAELLKTDVSFYTVLRAQNKAILKGTPRISPSRTDRGFSR